MTICHFKRRVLDLSVLAALGLAAGAHAQTQPNIGDVLRQAQPPVVPAPAAPALPALGGQQPIEPPLKALPGGPQIRVQTIEIVGNRVIATAALQALVADGVGKSLSLGELESLAQRITKLYRTQGYFVARAYIPAQEVTGGAVRIRVVEGSYGDFKLKNQSRVRDDIVQGILDDVKQYDLVSLDTLERAMLIVSDTPGAQVTRADVLPGAKVGTSDFAVDTAATAPYNGYVLLDNYGSAYTGRTRLSLGVDFNSPTGRGDRLSLSALGTDSGGILNGRAAYSTLLRPDGLRGEVALSRTEYVLGDTYKALDAKGTANVLDGTLSYPIRRIRAQTIETSLNVAYKDLEDKIQSTNTTTPKQSRTATAAVNLRDEASLLGSDGLTQASLALTWGDLEIKDATARANDAAGANTAGGFAKVVGSVSRVSLLPAQFSLNTSLRMQQALNAKNLDGSERMAVSGNGAVMGYPGGELIGSNATLLRLELSRPLPKWVEGLGQSWFVSASWGQAEAARRVTTTDGLRSISDVGLGWTGNWRTASLRVQLMHRLEDSAPTSEPYPQDKLLAQASWTF